MKTITVVLMIMLIGFYHSSAQERKELKVMTYNIWNGFDWGKDTVRRRQVVQWIKGNNPDVVALQELCGYSQEKLEQDAREWGHPYAVILKEQGYPVGLTSKRPIEIKEKVLDQLWHGMLHAETYGIDFFVVHLSPADVEFRAKEAGIITARIKESGSDRFIILGDFNSHSPFDADLNNSRPDLLAKYIPKPDAKYSNLRLGEFDYSVMAGFLSLPAVDVSMNFIQPDDRYTFPSPVLVGSYRTAESVMTTRERIDYILASPALARRAMGSKIFNEGAPQKLSDHYPVMVTFGPFEH